MAPRGLGRGARPGGRPPGTLTPMAAAYAVAGASGPAGRARGARGAPYARAGRLAEAVRAADGTSISARSRRWPPPFDGRPLAARVRERPANRSARPPRQEIGPLSPAQPERRPDAERPGASRPSPAAFQAPRPPRGPRPRW